jgi:phosphoglycolate phosphatase
VLIAFDFDGTLVDSIRDLTESANELSVAYGGPRHDVNAVTFMVGEGARTLVARVMEKAGHRETPPGAYEEFLQIYDRRMMDTTAPYPGTIDTLAVLSKSHQLVMVTNKPAAATERIMSYTGLDRYFPDCVFGDGELPRKPNPAGLQSLMHRYGATEATTLMVGDSDVDLATARAAGVRICLARYGFGFRRIDPSQIQPGDGVIDGPADLLDVLSAYS